MEIPTLYDLGNLLGTGTFAKTYIGKRRTDGFDVAVKVIQKKHQNYKESLVEKEIEIMSRIQCPRCVSLMDVIETPTAIYLVEELCTGGELFERLIQLGHVSEKDAAVIIKQVIEGIAYLHSKGIVHRDIKPENLLMMSSNPKSMQYNMVKITDFGLSSLKHEENDSMTTACGTPEYMAPEMIHCALIKDKKERAREGYDEKVDVWAIGVILYIMICGYPPFLHENRALMLFNIQHGCYNFSSEEWRDVSKRTKQFVSLLLTTDPIMRPSASQLLRHPYITNIKTLDTRNLNNAEKLSLYMEARRSRKALNAVRAVKRMEILVQHPSISFKETREITRLQMIDRLKLIKSDINIESDMPIGQLDIM